MPELLLFWLLFAPLFWLELLPLLVPLDVPGAPLELFVMLELLVDCMLRS